MPKVTKQVSGRKLHYIVVLLIGMIIGLVGGYLLASYLHGTGLFTTNKYRDVKTEAASGCNWAQPLELPGLPNLHRVSDQLYRGAQPTAEGMRELQRLGIKTVVNLRSFHSDRDEIGNTSLAYEHIYVKAWHPEEKEIVRFLQIVMDKERMPVFVHCRHGADRTGMMCALYRIVVQNWTKQEAIEEMSTGGFGFHSVWNDLIEYIRQLDVDKIKHRALSVDSS